MEQLESYLLAADITLPAEILDHIENSCPRESRSTPTATSYGDHELRPEAQRR